jgi:hypothetical protein
MLQDKDGKELFGHPRGVLRQEQEKNLGGGFNEIAGCADGFMNRKTRASI